ncbi:MAG: hypothetical protein FWF26_04620 [Treponema sp.]|nr:hypothetical protein [Treponema sp.]
MNFTLAIAAISLATSIVLFLYVRWTQRRGNSADGILAQYRIEVQRLIEDIDLATERDSLLVEARINTLKKLLEDTDKRIAVYFRELENSRTGEALYAKLGKEFHASAVQAAPTNAAPRQAALALATSAAELKQAPAAASVLPAAAEAPESDPAGAPGGNRRSARGKKSSAGFQKPDLRVQIAELAVQGLGSAAIASKLKVSVSEVDLALSLIRK